MTYLLRAKFFLLSLILYLSTVISKDSYFTISIEQLMRPWLLNTWVDGSQILRMEQKIEKNYYLSLVDKCLEEIKLHMPLLTQKSRAVKPCS